MTIWGSITVQWGTSSEAFHCVPAQIVAHGVDTIAAPGERVAVPSGRCTLTIDVPGYVRHTVAVQVGEQQDRQIHLNAARLSRSTNIDEVEQLPGGLSVNAMPWTPPVLAPRRQNGLIVQRGRGEVALAPNAGSTASWEVELIAPRTPRRRLIVPPMSTGDHYQLRWHRSGEQVRRPRIEPADFTGRLLMEYLLKGQYTLASVAARSIERIRGDADPLAWVMPSYTQLLIGYSYALGRDWDRLTYWCERTAAATELSSDGLVLAAEDAWRRDDPALARELLAAAAKIAPPSITLGGELALDLATSLALRLAQPAPKGHFSDRNESGYKPLELNHEQDRDMLALSNAWTRTLSRADSQSLSLSTAETDRISPDLEQAPWPERLRGLMGYLRRLGHYTRLRTRPIVFAFSKELLVLKSESSMRRPLVVGGLLAVILVAFLAQTVLLTMNAERPLDPIVWLAEGTVLAIILVAIGAFAAASVYRSLVTAAERRADDAQSEARYFHEAAMKGRALAAVLKADARDIEDLPDEAKAICLRHAAVADQLDIFEPEQPLRVAPRLPRLSAD